MSNFHNSPTRRREVRPQRIQIADDVLVRNDIVAREEGVSVRTLNRGDKQGDPYTYVGGVKYRPEKGHQEFRARSIIVHGKPLQRRVISKRSLQAAI